MQKEVILSFEEDETGWYNMKKEGDLIRCKECRFSSTYFYEGETNWTCNNVEDGLGRDVSEDSYCSSAIERKADGVDS